MSEKIADIDVQLSPEQEADLAASQEVAKVAEKKELRLLLGQYIPEDQDKIIDAFNAHRTEKFDEEMFFLPLRNQLSFYGATADCRSFMASLGTEDLVISAENAIDLSTVSNQEQMGSEKEVVAPGNSGVEEDSAPMSIKDQVIQLLKNSNQDEAEKIAESYLEYKAEGKLDDFDPSADLRELVAEYVEQGGADKILSESGKKTLNIDGLDFPAKFRERKVSQPEPQQGNESNAEFSDRMVQLADENAKNGRKNRPTVVPDKLVPPMEFLDVPPMGASEMPTNDGKPAPRPPSSSAVDIANDKLSSAEDKGKESASEGVKRNVAEAQAQPIHSTGGGGGGSYGLLGGLVASITDAVRQRGERKMAKIEDIELRSMEETSAIVDVKLTKLKGLAETVKGLSPSAPSEQKEAVLDAFGKASEDMAKCVQAESQAGLSRVRSGKISKAALEQHLESRADDYQKIMEEAEGAPVVQSDPTLLGKMNAIKDSTVDNIRKMVEKLMQFIENFSFGKKTGPRP